MDWTGLGSKKTHFNSIRSGSDEGVYATVGFPLKKTCAFPVTVEEIGLVMICM